MLKEVTVQKFQGDLRGDLVQPGDANYDEARKVWT